MTRHLFRNRWHRIYFQLFDAFAQSRCPFCILLSRFERTLITSFLASPGRRKKSKIPLKTLCVVHKIRVKKIAADDPSLLTMLKTMVRTFPHWVFAVLSALIAREVPVPRTDPISRRHGILERIPEGTAPLLRSFGKMPVPSSCRQRFSKTAERPKRKTERAF